MTGVRMDGLGTRMSTSELLASSLHVLLSHTIKTLSRDRYTGPLDSTFDTLNFPFRGVRVQRRVAFSKDLLFTEGGFRAPLQNQDPQTLMCPGVPLRAQERSTSTPERITP